MVVGGRRPGTTFIDEVDVVSLDPINRPVPDCLRKRRQFPYGVTQASAEAITEGTINFGMEK